MLFSEAMAEPSIQDNKRGCADKPYSSVRLLAIALLYSLREAQPEPARSTTATVAPSGFPSIGKQVGGVQEGERRGAVHAAP